MQIKDNNIFGDFIKVVAGLLIGLASFQILAPLIWDYLSELLHLEKFTSYCIIVCFYFITPCILFLVWWYFVKDKISALLYLQPSSTQKFGLSVVNVLSVFFPVFFVANFLMLLFAFVFDNDWLFYGILMMASGVTIFVLYKISAGVIHNIKAERVKKKRKYYSLIIFISFLTCLFLTFEILYLSYSDKTKSNNIKTFERLRIKSKSDVINAFRLNDFREALKNTRGKFEYNLSRIYQMQEINRYKKENNPVITPESISTEVLNLVATEQFPGALINNSVDFSGIDERQLQKTEQALLTVVYMMDKVSDSIVKRNSQILLKAPPYYFDSLLNYQKIKTIGTVDSVVLAKAEFRYKEIINTLETLEDNTVKVCKKQLALILSNNQMKGIFLFGFTLIIMLCIYLLLKTNEDALAQLNALKENENNKILKDRTEVNSTVLSDSWLIVNVLVWLLIPFFKPVNESNVRVDKPLQAFTITNYITNEKTVEPQPEVNIHNPYPLTINNYPNSRIETQPVSTLDTLWLKEELNKINTAIKYLNHELRTAAASNYDDAELMKTIDSIRQRVYNINSTAQQANAMHKMYMYLMENRKTERVNDKSFYPNSNIK